MTSNSEKLDALIQHTQKVLKETEKTRIINRISLSAAIGTYAFGLMSFALASLNFGAEERKVVGLILISTLLISYVYGEVDKTAFVTRVNDGDTFDISTGERIRLADVDAPEYYEYGYSEATDYLASLIDGKTVYLDVDDVYIYDYRGTGDRLVCVVYVDYDPIHLINVNEALLEQGYAEISNFDNEFYPYTWSLLIPKDGDSETIPPDSNSLSGEDYTWLVIGVIGLILIIVVLSFIRDLDKSKDKAIR